MNPLRRCNEIDQAQLDRVRRNSYVRDLYLHTLVKSTLIGFDLVSVEEVKSLEAVAVAGAASGSLLPELENHEAKQAVMRFFDTLNMSNDRELMEAVDGIQPHTLVPSVFEGIISNADSLRSLLLADRAGQESYRVFLAYKMGRTVDDPSVDNEMAKYLAFVYVYENGAKLDTLIAEMIDAEGDPNQPGRGYSWDEYPPASKVAKIIVPGDMSSRKPRRINRRTEKWSLASRFVYKFSLQNGHTRAFVVELDRDHFFFPSDFCFLPLVAQRICAEPDIGMITFRTDVAADRHKLQPSGFNHNAIMELGGLWDSGNEGSAAAIEAWMQRLRCPPNEMGQGGVNGFRVVNDPRLYVERRLDMDESESSHAVLRCADLA